MTTLFSADSHVVEVEACYAEIDRKFESLRPRAVEDPKQGAIMVVPGMDITIPAGALSRAGLRFEDWAKPQPWSKIHPAAYDPKARLAIQDEENVTGEIIYPSVGMVLCLHKDVRLSQGLLRGLQPLARRILRDRSEAAHRDRDGRPALARGGRSELEEIARQG